MEFTIVGAGMAGAFLALSLGREGHTVTVYDLRPDPRVASGEGSSMNLGLSRRGLDALEHAGLRSEVDALVMPMRGRLLHDREGGLRFSTYGRGGILAIQRSDLGALLVDAAAKVPGVRFVFEARCTGIEKDTATAYFVDQTTGKTLTAKADVLVGADGVFSAVRRFLQHDERAGYTQEFLEWGWRELHIPARPDGGFRMDPDVFHLWPRGDTMMFAHPNRDGSFTCSCVLPFRGPRSFETLRDAGDVERLFRDLFPDLLELVPDVGTWFFDRPTMNLVTTRTTPWHHEDKVVLVGDACHAVFPFLAQGMNAAFEDCRELVDSLRRHPDDPGVAFERYYSQRKPNTDALAEMSRRNFAELRDTVRSPAVRVEKALDVALERVSGQRWMPLHAMVTNTTIPYARAQRRAGRQHRVLRALGVAGLVAAIGTALRKRLS
jgi:kynurenine 3-monooxygenase